MVFPDVNTVVPLIWNTRVGHLPDSESILPLKVVVGGGGGGGVGVGVGVGVGAGGGAACVSVIDCPAMLSEPLRAALAFAATVIATVRVPLPDWGETLIHGTLLPAVH